MPATKIARMIRVFVCRLGFECGEDRLAALDLCAPLRQRMRSSQHRGMSKGFQHIAEKEREKGEDAIRASGVAFESVREVGRCPEMACNKQRACEVRIEVESSPS
jgi:hypothetical protein